MNDIVTRETAAAIAVPEVTPMALVQLAVQQGANVEQLERLLQLQMKWEADQARKAFHVAFSAFKAEAVSIIRNKPITAGPLQGKSYADLFAVVDAITPKLSKHDLSASWRLSKDEKEWLEITCTITHILGHSESVSMGAGPDVGGAKNGIQARASTVTYLQRYTLLAATGLAAKDTDNDGNGAGSRATVEPDDDGKKALEACGSDDALKKAWSALTADQRKTLTGVMADCKKRIREADGASV